MGLKIRIMRGEKLWVGVGVCAGGGGGGGIEGVTRRFH